jgi:transposase
VLARGVAVIELVYVEQVDLGEFSRAAKLETFSKEALIQRLTVVEEEYHRAVKEIYRLKNQDLNDNQLQLVMNEKIGELRAALYGASTERYKKPVKPKESEPAKPRTKQPSQRYPNVPVREQVIAMDPVPGCTSCGKLMSDSGMTEDSEQLTVIPKKFEIVVNKRVKYRCSCHSCITTAPAAARIVEGSSYSDEMILDVALSKYCDLIPIHRYVLMAARSGVSGLPQQSLIELTHELSDFVYPAYELLKAGVMKSRVLNADETPHKMLEGSDTKNWYLWGFSTPKLCFLECHDTRSGDVASEILQKSSCEVLVTDVYSGYPKATRVSNEIRKQSNLPLIRNANCNAHARRYFFKSWSSLFKEPEFYLDHYHEIYQLDGEAKGKPSAEILVLREKMKTRFEAMKERAIAQEASYSEKSQYGKALRYFIKNYEGLTLFLAEADVPIDNNSQERLLRSPVVGRKTWYGTHSERGAKTAAVLFSLVETCKLSGVNPREYFNNLTKALLAGQTPFTPADIKPTA